jgi:Rad3-related DNA helicase
MSEFLLKWYDTMHDDSFINVASRYFNKENNKTAKLEIVALDPSKVTQPVFSSTYANVIMSGTLQPLEAFARITRLPESTVKFLAHRRFQKSMFFGSYGVPLLWRIDQMIERINEVVNSTPTNTGILPF